MRSMIVAAALLASGAAVAEEPTFLFDALRLPRYKLAWTALLKDVQPTPDWLLHFNEFDGEAGDLKEVAMRASPTSCRSSASRRIARTTSSRCCSPATAATLGGRWRAATSRRRSSAARTRRSRRR